MRRPERCIQANRVFSSGRIVVATTNAITHHLRLQSRFFNEEPMECL